MRWAAARDVALALSWAVGKRWYQASSTPVSITCGAALIGGRIASELTLRLKARAAALLVTDDDPAQALFTDVGQLYDLRFKLVHGGQITQKDLRKIIAKISTVPADATERHFGVALG